MAEIGIPSNSNAESQSSGRGVTKKRRNLPGTPDPNAEVVALSPKTLFATNRFICEVCNKGFQREQNLQLHRRGHNLPWKLRQRTGNEVRKRVYVCPETTCIHHNPARALGDLTGIKKHFCRKHGEKKFKCQRCTKSYAVQSDWKAHMKICGSREYRCDCGTIFARKDSFVTHRAFCDALAQESTRSQSWAINGASPSRPPSPLSPSTPAGALYPVLSVQSSELPENPSVHLKPQPGMVVLSTAVTTMESTTTASCGSATYNTNTSSHNGLFASIFAPSTLEGLEQPSKYPSSSYLDLLCAMGRSEYSTINPMSLSLSSSMYLSSSRAASLSFPITAQGPDRDYVSGPQPALSATALLQKAAHMGVKSDKPSFLHGLGLAMSSSSDPYDNGSLAPSTNATALCPSHWSNGVKLENGSLAPGLDLGIASDGVDDLMIGPSAPLFSDKPTTLDFLGLGMGASEVSSRGFSAFLTSIGGGINAAAASIANGIRSDVDA